MTTAQVWVSCKGEINTSETVFPLILSCWTVSNGLSIFRPNRNIRCVCWVWRAVREELQKTVRPVRVSTKHFYTIFEQTSPSGHLIFDSALMDNQMDTAPPGCFGVRHSLDRTLGCLWPAWGVIKVRAKFSALPKRPVWAGKKPFGVSLTWQMQSFMNAPER